MRKRPETKRRKALSAAQSASIFAALGDATRLGLVASLCALGPSSIARLTEGAGVTRQAVAKHLRVMEGAGLVRVGREGRETVWELEPARLEEARRWLDLVSHQWDGALARLKSLVEDGAGDDRS